MCRLASMLCQQRDTDPQDRSANSDRNRDAGSVADADSHRYFALQPILSPTGRVVGHEALFRAGWEDSFQGDSNAATRIMIDNWLLYGFEDLTGERLTFLNCTRETLLSGLLTLLPRWAVFEILETVEPDAEVLKACRMLKKMGYLISLDDFESPDRMEGFLSLADFIKIDFRITDSGERARLVRRLKGSPAILIAEKIETEAEFRLAAWEGFQFFQGHYFRERASFAKTRDFPIRTNCLRILETLSGRGFALKKLMDLIDLEPGIGCRLLRRANWIAAQGSPVNTSPINTCFDALKLVGKNEFRKLVMLAMFSDAKDWNALPPEFLEHGKNAVLGYGSKHESALKDHRPHLEPFLPGASQSPTGKLHKMPAWVGKDKTPRPKE